MTRPEIEQDLAQYRAHRDQTLANANAINGIIQYLEAKLAGLKAEDAKSVDGQATPEKE